MNQVNRFIRRTIVLTGVVTRVNPDANHLQIYFARMNPERKNVVRDDKNQPIIWEVEMSGSAQSAEDGISVSSFPEGTLFSVGMRPMRNGEPKGFRQGPLFKCPGRTPPKPGKHCDSVEGSEAFGAGRLPTPTERLRIGRCLGGRQEESRRSGEDRPGRYEPRSPLACEAPGVDDLGLRGDRNR